MIIFEIAVYICFILLVMFVSVRILWLVFFLFCYRFWESILTYNFLSKYIHFAKPMDYTIAIILIAIITYAIVIGITYKTPFLRYPILLALVLYTIRHYSISDIFLFKSYFVSKGMWDISYWQTQLKGLLSFSIDDFSKLAETTWVKFWGALTRFADYLKS